MSRPRRRCRRASSRRRGRFTPSLLLTGCLLSLGLAFLNTASAEEPRMSFLETGEGRRLVALWHTMLDHSCDAVYNPTRFRELAPDLEAAGSDLAALAQRGALSKANAEQLRNLFHMRYQYIGECHYSTRSSIRVSGAEASRAAAQWVVELQLSLLQRSPTSKAERELAEAAKENIAYQLAFVHHLDEFEAESDRRRMKLRDRQEAGAEADLEAFEAEYHRKRNLLLEAYRQRRLPRVRAVDEVIPYVVALTRAKPLPHAAARGPARPDS